MRPFILGTLRCTHSGVQQVVCSGFSPVPSSTSWAFVEKAGQENKTILAIVCLSSLVALQSRYVELGQNCCGWYWPKPFLLLCMHSQSPFYFLLFLFFFSFVLHSNL